MTQGILLVDKPAGWTSFDVVNYVRKIVAEKENKKTKQVKVGHSGTLDPFATGLLIILIGKEYTKKADQFLKLDKTYEFSVKLGYKSTTGDTEGEITKEFSEVIPKKEQVEEALKSFIGDITQIPPKFSAIKINGKKSYELAREGKDIVHKGRTVTIYSLKLIKYDYPDISLEAKVSSGTYIRTLSEDIAKRLNTSAYTFSLRRTSIGTYDVKDVLVLDKNDPLIVREALDHLKILTIPL